MSVFTPESALLIVDMVRDFAEAGGSLFVPAAREIIPEIHSLANEARKRGIPVIYVNDSHDSDDREFQKWPPHCIQGTPGGEIVEELKPHEEDHLISKKRFSAFYGTELDNLLRSLGVKRLLITGTVTNICVFVTALEAVMRDYDVVVPSKAVAALTEEEHTFSLKQMQDVFGVEVIW
ncbi:MAG: cysteine hydrolase [Actinomycetota bacterium]|nr:cysteine hydrolase [Actinomycetota bacterium]